MSLMLSCWLQSLLSSVLGLLATKESKQVLQNISFQSSSSVVYLGARQTGCVSQRGLHIIEVRKRWSILNAMTLGEQTLASSAIQ